MSDKEIQEYVRKCPYFGNPETIDSTSSCDLEFHYRPICPSEECICAEKLGLKKPKKPSRVSAHFRKSDSLLKTSGICGISFQ